MEAKSGEALAEAYAMMENPSDLISSLRLAF